MKIIAIRIVTDSTCDLSVEDQKRYDIEVLPLTVHFGSESFRDGVNLTNEEFYDKLDASKELPTTSQVPPQDFADLFQNYIDQGDEIVGIFLSGGISGTYHSACIAKDIVESDRIYIVDSRSATMSLALLVTEASKMREQGLPASEIVEKIQHLTGKVRFLAAVNTLKYLRKGGRVSATTAVIGEVLGMKPIVSVLNGTVQSIGKARGMPAAFKAMLQDALADLPDLRYSVVIAHACAPELANKLLEYIKKPLGITTNWLMCSIGSVIGTYAGRGAVGFAYIAE